MKFLPGRKYLIVIGLAGIVLLGEAAIKPPVGKFTNLKVLPSNISEKELNKIMVDDFEDALGVNCGFCHAKEKDSEKLDYASDDNPQKENAREMMRMTIGINKDYFKMKDPLIGDSLLRVSCITCHNGQTYPGE